MGVTGRRGDGDTARRKTVRRGDGETGRRKTVRRIDGETERRKTESTNHCQDPHYASRQPFPFPVFRLSVYPSSFRLPLIRLPVFPTLIHRIFRTEGERFGFASLNDRLVAHIIENVADQFGQLGAVIRLKAAGGDCRGTNAQA